MRYGGLIVRQATTYAYAKEYMRAIQASPHRPMHMEVPHGWYFLTARTLDGLQLFHGHERMSILNQVIGHGQRLFSAKIYGYILWSNHYHIIISLEEETLGDFVRNIHTHSARFLNKRDNTPGRRVWYQYWDRMLRIQYSLDDFYRRVNYIMHNPIKHGWCKSFDEALTYPWSSIPLWAKTYGRDGLWECWMKYPVTDWSE